MAQEEKGDFLTIVRKFIIQPFLNILIWSLKAPFSSYCVFCRLYGERFDPMRCGPAENRSFCGLNDDDENEDGGGKGER